MRRGNCPGDYVQVGNARPPYCPYRGGVLCVEENSGTVAASRFLDSRLHPNIVTLTTFVITNFHPVG